MNQLVMPLANAGFQIDCDDAFSEQPVTGAMAAVVVSGGQLHWKIRQAELLIRRNLRPDAGISVNCPRIVQPGFDSELARLGDSVEDPETLAGARVESANVAFHVAHGSRNAAGAMRGPD